MGCRQIHLTSPAIVTLPFYCHGKKNQIFPLHTGPLPSMRTAKLSATCLAPLQSFSPLNTFPSANPGKAQHRSPVLGFLWPSEIALQKHPQPLFSLPSSQGPLDSSAPYTGNHRAEQQPGASCRSPGKSSPRFGNGSHMLTPYPVSGTTRHDAGLLYKGS